MATYLGTSAVFEVRSTATAGNVNGGGFNPANTHGITDGVISGGTGNTPTLSSATYTFLDADDTYHIYFPAQANITAGWYQITSQSGGVATLSAAVGAAVQVLNNRYVTNTIAGCATTAAPTGVTFLVDYSQNNTARYSNSVLTGTTTSCTDATNPFTAQMVGNFICIASGTGITAGWYEIVSVAAGTATLDRTAGASYSLGVIKIGGAVSLGGSTTGITDVIFFALGASSNTSGTRFFIKGGSSITYTLSGAPTQSSGSTRWPAITEGYATTRGDRPTALTRPTMACGANIFTTAVSNDIYSLIFTGTADAFLTGVRANLYYCKVLNNSTTAGLVAYQVNTTGICMGCEFISYRGYAVKLATAGGRFIGCTFHDSDTGFFNNGGSEAIIEDCILYSNVTAAYTDTTTASAADFINGNTFYGAENKLGIGLNLSQTTLECYSGNNIFYGFVTGVSAATGQIASLRGDYNDYYNNTTDVTNVYKSANDIAVNPSFTSVTQRTGSTATTTAGNHLVQSGATFVTWGITAGIDCVYISAGTGVTAGIYGILSVDSETQITVDITLTANATADKTWSITQGHNFLPTGAI